MLIDVLPDIQAVRLSWFFPNQWVSKRSQLSGSLENLLPALAEGLQCPPQCLQPVWQYSVCYMGKYLMVSMCQIRS
jgi:hypothetical protein